MAGHSKWHQIKHKKEAADKKRAQLWNKLLAAIQAAARENPHPDFNPRLRATIQKAKEAQVPQENILRAIEKAASEPTEELIIEAYGPAGCGLIIEAVTNNKNRTLANIKKILSDFDAKITGPGAAAWIFEMTPEMNRQPKFKQPVSAEDKEKIQHLLEALEDNEEVIKVYTNAEL